MTIIAKEPNATTGHDRPRMVCHVNGLHHSLRESVKFHWPEGMTGCCQIVASTVTTSTTLAKTVCSKNHVCVHVISFVALRGLSNHFKSVWNNSCVLLYMSKYTMHATHVIMPQLELIFNKYRALHNVFRDYKNLLQKNRRTCIYETCTDKRNNSKICFPVSCFFNRSSHFCRQAMRVYVVTMVTHVDACVAKTWISYRCVRCHPWCTNRTSLVVKKKKPFSVFLRLWTIVIVINVCNHEKNYETPCITKPQSITKAHLKQ
jgi:hypothetical protein